MKKQLQESAEYVRSLLPYSIEGGIYLTLGSGFKKILEDVQSDVKIDLDAIPHVKAPLVAGHGREILICKINDIPVLIQSGRTHLYEGHDVSDVVYTTRLAHTLGLNKFICTNASGSLNKKIKPGTLCVITDHINLTGQNALTGKGSQLGETFVDMLQCYHPKWVKMMTDKFDLTETVYAGLTGPTYETAAETRMLGILGADIVGMSTVQEVIAAQQLGMKTLGVSLATNYAAGIAESVNHQDVLKSGQEAAPLIRKIFPQIIDAIAK
ncbi:purine-nucleoside phosphorylase [Oligoflexaceae bacterium]|nr:purine-nucleoside phosphorylase [Oligoflexaceae bacterium]